MDQHPHLRDEKLISYQVNRIMEAGRPQFSLHPDPRRSAGVVSPSNAASQPETPYPQEEPGRSEPEYELDSLADLAEKEWVGEGESILLCSHILADGRRCRAAARGGYQFCRFHIQHRRRIADCRSTRRRKLVIPPIEDRAGVQHAINDLLHAYTNQVVDSRQFRDFIYALSIAMQNVAAADFAGRTDEEYVDQDEDDAEDNDDDVDEAEE